MALTQAQILEIKKRAASQGISSQEVDAALPQILSDYEKRNSTALQPTNQTTAPGAGNNTPASPQQDGNFITKTAKAIVDPALKFGSFVGESVAQASRVGVDAIAGNQSIFGSDEINKQVGQLTLQNKEILAQMKTEKNPAKKKELAQKSREIDAQIEQLGSQARDIGNKQQTFVMQDPNAIANRGKILETGAKRTAGAAAYAIPGGSSVKTLAAAGAASGALSAYSQDNATVGDVLTGAATGGAIGGAVGIAGKSLEKVSKMIGNPTKQDENLLTKIGTSLREDATRIRVKPSVYGAKKEKLIQETLDTLGITGGPAEKYSQLEAAMKQLEDTVSAEVAQNPDAAVSVQQLTKNFGKKLQSEVRTKSLTSKTAQNEINGYLTDLMRAADIVDQGSTSAGTSLVNDSSLVRSNAIDLVSNPNVDAQVKLDMLVKLKKLANQDYGSIANKLERGTPLTDREKVAFYGRQVLDEAITKLDPKIKDATMMQSHLYDAAAPLSAARNTTPTFRILGVTVPKEKVLEDWMGRHLIDLGKMTKSAGSTSSEAIQNALDSMSVKEQSDLYQAMLNSGIVLSTSNNSSNNGGKNGQQEQTTIDQNQNGSGQQNNSNDNLQNGGQSTFLQNNQDIIPQTAQHPIPKFREYASKDEMIQAAFAEGLGSQDVRELAKLWDEFAPTSTSASIPPQVQSLIEQRSLLTKAGLSTTKVDAQLSQYGYDLAPQGSDLSATTENRVQLAVSGLRYVNDIEKMIADDPQKIFLQSLPGQLGARDYDSAAFKAVEGLLRARSGAAIPPEEVRNYMKANLPRVGDSNETIDYKLRTFKQDLTDVANSGGSFNAQAVLNQ